MLVRTRSLLLAVLPLALLACGDDGVGPGGDDAEFTLTYQGDVNGRLEAEGSPRVGSDGEFDVRTFAAAIAEGTEISITGVEVQSSTSADVAAFVLSQPTQGSHNFDDDTFGIIAFNVDPRTDEEDLLQGRLFVATSGTLNLTSVTADRIRGTARGTAIEFDADTGMPTGGTISFESSFNVPVVQDPDSGSQQSLSPVPALLDRALRASGLR